MPRRTVGDIYEIALPDGRVSYMQHVDTDIEQLSSAVVCVYAPTNTASSIADFQRSSSNEAMFYAHVLLKAGETLKVWRKVGSAHIGNVPQLMWRSCQVSERTKEFATEWYVWRTGVRYETVGPRSPLLERTELGLVMSPQSIVDRISTGRWQLKHPRVGTP